MCLVHNGIALGERLSRVASFRSGRKRLLVTTPTVARGLDVPRARVVLLAKVPGSVDAYAAMVARCGRFASPGLAVTFVADAWQSSSSHGDQRQRLSVLRAAHVDIERVEPPRLRREVAAVTQWSGN